MVTADAARTMAITDAITMSQSGPPATGTTVVHSLTAPLASALASLPSGPNATPFTPPMPACREAALARHFSCLQADRQHGAPAVVTDFHGERQAGVEDRGQVRVVLPGP